MNITKIFYALLLSVSIISPAYAQDAKDTDVKEKKIESASEQKEKTESEDSDENPNEDKASKAKIGARNINAFSRKAYSKGTALGGYFDTEFTAPFGGNSSFNQHHLILQVSSLYNDRIFFNTEVEFEYGATINRNTNDGQLRVEQAFLDYKFDDWLNFRAGGLLIPLGRLNVLHDSDFRDTTARPLFNRTIIPSTWTETGLGFYGTFYPNDEIEMNYEAYVTQGINGNIKDGRGLADTAPSLVMDNNNNKALSTRVSLSPFIGLDLGLGGYYAAYDDKDKNSLGMVVADFNYTIGPFELLGEGGFTAFTPVEQKDSQGTVTSTLQGPMWGYYLEGHYNFFPDFLKFSILGKDFNNPSITLFTRLDQVDTDMSQLNINDRTQVTLGFNYRPITSVVFKFEYQINIENQAIIKLDPTKEKPNNQFLASVAAGF